MQKNSNTKRGEMLHIEEMEYKTLLVANYFLRKTFEALDISSTTSCGWA